MNCSSTTFVVSSSHLLRFSRPSDRINKETWRILLPLAPGYEPFFFATSSCYFALLSRSNEYFLSVFISQDILFGRNSFVKKWLKKNVKISIGVPTQCFSSLLKLWREACFYIVLNVMNNPVCEVWLIFRPTIKRSMVQDEGKLVSILYCPSLRRFV